ncbi:MAG: class I SAM-dependent methyltransferase [Solirubrobacteraceae bacterium]|nr:class I SAM-dependent methyltransferase [Solirubrobacteraceae bacterium]
MSEQHEAIWASLPEGLEPEGYSLRRAFLLEHVDPGPPAPTVLDVGCGEGWFSEALRDAGAEPVAVDVAAEALRRAERRVPGLVTRLWAHDEPLPLDDNSVDIAWAGEVIEHVADVAPWLSELRRALKPGGTLLLTTPHVGRAALLGAAVSKRRFTDRFEPRSDHVHFFAPSTLGPLLEDLGFTVDDMRLAGGRPLARETILARATRG